LRVKGKPVCMRVGDNLHSPALRPGWACCKGQWVCGRLARTRGQLYWWIARTVGRGGAAGALGPVAVAVCPHLGLEAQGAGSIRLQQDVFGLRDGMRGADKAAWGRFR
jgi:hypothetical protein